MNMLAILSTAIISIVVLAAVAAAAHEQEQRLIDLVDTRIGTGGFGFGVAALPVGGMVPFGAMRIGPDTSLGLEPIRIPFASYGGYYYNDDFIECFSHTHVVGAGAADFMNFGVMPIRIPHGSPQPSAKIIENAGYKSKFSHSTETATPGYYKVLLATPNVTAEVTASGTLSGMHRYTCHNNNEDCALVLDLCHAAPTAFFNKKYNAACRLAQLENFTLVDVPGRGWVAHVSASVTMSGSMTGRSPVNGGMRIYWFAEISFNSNSNSSSPLQASAWMNNAYTNTVDDAIKAGATSSSSLGVILSASAAAGVSSTTGIWTVRAGLSFISCEYAKQNLAEQQQPLSSFDAILSKTQDTWESLLSRIKISDSSVSSSSLSARIFYSGIYRSHLAPTRYTEHRGQFIGMDQQQHTVAAGSERYSDFSLWDVYRCQFSLLTLTFPDVVVDAVTSMMNMVTEFERPPYNSQNRLPQWTIGNIETGSMSGWHSASIMLQAADFNLSQLVVPAKTNSSALSKVYGVVSKAVLGMVQQRMGSQQQHYYQPGDVGDTIEYSINAGAVWHSATRRNDAKTAAAISPYAFDSLRNCWNSTRKLFCRRAANLGPFDCPEFDWLPYGLGEQGYIEGSAVDYRWSSTPHAIDMLINELLPNKAEAMQLLENYFEATIWWQDTFKWNTTLPNGFYWASNEPTFIDPFLFAMAGPEYQHRTTYWVTKLTNIYYNDGPGGVPGNEDYGALSSWLVWSYIGLYPIVPTSNFSILTPRFDKIDFVLPQPTRYGLRLSIRCTNRTAGVEQNYVASASVNGIQLSNPWFSWFDLFKNAPGHNVAVIEMVLSPVPVVFAADHPQNKGIKKLWVPEKTNNKKKGFLNEAEIKYVAKMMRAYKNNKRV